jgi:hypothetical protein
MFALLDIISLPVIAHRRGLAGIRLLRGAHHPVEPE